MPRGNGDPEGTPYYYASADIDQFGLLQGIVEFAEDCILSKTLDGIITSWNKACEETLGYTRSEIIGTSIFDIVPAYRHDEERAIIAKISEGERIERFETERIAKNGTIVTFSLTISPITDRAGKIIACSSIMHDISEQKLAEARLSEERGIVDAIHQIGSALSSELDLHKVVQAVTNAATEITGAEFGSFFYNVYDDKGGSYMLYTLSGVPREAFEKFPMPRNTAIFAPTFNGEGTVRIDNVKQDPRYGKNPPYNGMPQGHLPVTSYLAVPVISQNGEVIGGLFFGHSQENVFKERHERIIEGLASQAAVAMDNARLYEQAQKAIGERDELLKREQRLRESAESANRSKDEFLSLLSHELRTPLNSILGWATTLNSGQSDPETLKRGIEVIQRNAKLQSRLIEDMLDVSRIVSGKLRLDAQPVDLTSVINAAVESLRPASDAKHLRLYVVLNYGEGMVLGDPVRLQQVAWNLVSNAIKFTPKGGSVTVSLERVNSHYELTVSDTGPGIDEDFLPVVFDRFRQADSSTVKQHSGLGLGLAIVKQLVELHGGNVRAANRTDVCGAVFTILLPVMAFRLQQDDFDSESAGAGYRTEAIVPDGVQLPDLTGVSVLVVDDEKDARVFLKSFLERCGATVDTCESAQSALDQLTHTRPDVLVSDIGMPGEDGYSFMRKVRQSETETHIPAIALTAYARSDDRMRALDAGFNMHVPKPVEPAELALVIASFIRRRP
jgi:PAS domain S-box-containing protein